MMLHKPLKRQNILLAILLVITLIFSASVVFAEDSDGQGDGVTTSSDTTTIYRLYSPINGEHLYTTDANEVRVLTTSHGWNYEGAGWFAPTSGQAVYRLYNAGLQNHLYTTDTNEVNVLTTQHGWVKDNNGQPLFYSGGSVGIYRLYNKDLRGLHLCTTDSNEYNVLPSYGWTQEGTKLYCESSGNSSYPYPYEKGNADISNTDSQYSIEADVKLSGSGTGYHAKILACTPTAAVSFGIQYDQCAVAPYTDKTAFLIENVQSNNSGGQTYTRTGLCNRDSTYHLMLTVQSDGRCDVYVNGTKVGSVNNPQLAGQTLYLRVEGSGRKNNDSVNATFTNIALKGSGAYNPNKTWGTYIFDTNAGIKSNTSGYATSKSITISGQVTGLSDTQDWDNAYGNVSGITQFVE